MNLKEFLNNNSSNYSGFYSLVTYNNTTEAIWFSKSKSNSDNHFEGYICNASKVRKISGDIELFCREYMSNNLIMPDEKNKQDYINNHIKILIKDGWLYDISKTKMSLHLPETIESIKIISKKECLDFLLKNKKTTA